MIPSPLVLAQFVSTWPLQTWLTLIVVATLVILTYFLYSIQWDASTANIASSFKSYLSGRTIFWILVCLRSSAVLLLLWMLGLWSWQAYKIERTELFLLIDASASMDSIDQPNSSSNSEGSSAKLSEGHSRASQIRQTFTPSFLKQLDQRFALRFFTVGERLKEYSLPGPPWPNSSWEERSKSEPRSELGNGLRDAFELARQSDVSAMVLWTDGINTDGIDLLQGALSGQKLGTNIPLSIVGVGQAPTDPDIRIRDLLVDESVFLGDRVRWEAVIERRDLEQSKFQVRLVDSTNQNSLQTSEVQFSPGQMEQTIVMSWPAMSIGEFPMHLEVDWNEKEKDRENNRALRTIQVRDSSIPILLLSSQPSYEFRFLKHLLERMRQPSSPDKPAFQLTSILEKAEIGYVEQDDSAQQVVPVGLDELQKFDAVIALDVSPTLLSPTIQRSLSRFVSEHGGGLLAVAGPNHLPFDYIDSEFSKLLPIDVQRAKRPADPPAFGWQLTKLGEEFLPLRLEASLESSQRIWPELPQQHWRCEDVQPKPVAQVLATCLIGELDSRTPGMPNATSMDINASSATAEPLLVLQYVGGGRVAFQASDETFQWQSHFGDDTYYQRYWIQLLRWLSTNRSQPISKADLWLPSNTFLEGETMEAMLRLPNRTIDQNGKPPSLTQVLRLNRNQSEWQNVQAVATSQNAWEYRARIDGLSPGTYRLAWTDSTDQSDVHRDFEVTANAGEQRILAPDVASMERSARETGGHYFRIDEMEELLKSLPKDSARRKQPLPPAPFWNHWMLVAMVVSILSVEWLVRRRLGLP